MQSKYNHFQKNIFSKKCLYWIYAIKCLYWIYVIKCLYWIYVVKYNHFQNQFSIVCNKIVYNVNIHILKCVYWKYSPLVVIYNLSRLRLSRLYMTTRGEYFQYTHFKMWILYQYLQKYLQISKTFVKFNLSVFYFIVLGRPLDSH